MANLYPIKLAAAPDAWRFFSMRKADLAFNDFKRQVLERDRYTCQYCGFQAAQYQEILNLDNNYRNNKLSNLVTACFFCSQCVFLEAVGKDDFGGGVLIYLPEISQADLNGLCHVLFCAMANVTDYSDGAQNIYRGLKLRSQVIEQRLGEGLSDPALFGRMLLDSPNEDRNKIEQWIFSSMRLLPSYSKFSRQIKTLSDSALDDLAGV